MKSPDKVNGFRSTTLAAVGVLSLVTGVIADRIIATCGPDIVAKLSELGESQNTLNCDGLTITQILEAFRTKGLTEADLDIIERSIYQRIDSVLGRMDPDVHYTFQGLSGEYTYNREHRALFGGRLSTVLLRDLDTQEIIPYSCYFVAGADVEVPEDEAPEGSHFTAQ